MHVGCHVYNDDAEKNIATLSCITSYIDGEQKWNARWQAEEKAKQFLSEMNLTEAS